MTEFFVGDVVKVEMPRGYSNRGVLGISLLYTTSPEARFDGASGTVSEINPVGPYSVHQYLIDFRTQDNSRAGLPWSAHWFREEWLSLVERVAAGVAPVAAQAAARSGGAVATATRPAGTTATISDRNVTGRGDGYLRVSGVAEAPDAFPIKGVDTSHRYYLVSDDEYAQTPPDVCFADEGAAQRAGYTREGSSTTDNVVDPHTAQAGGFSWGEDSELAAQDLPASDPGAGRTTRSPEGGGYFGDPAVEQPARDHRGEQRGDGKVGPDVAGEQPLPRRRVDATSETTDLDLGTSRPLPQGDDRATTDLRDPGLGGDTRGGDASGAGATAPSSPTGETTTLPAPADTTVVGARPSTPPGTSLLDPARLATSTPSQGGSTADTGGDELASKGDGGRTANQG